MSRSFRGRPDPSEDPRQARGGRGNPQQPYQNRMPERQPQMREDYSQEELSQAHLSQNQEQGDLKAEASQVDMGKRLVAGLVDVVTGYLLGMFFNCVPFINVYVHDQLVMVLYLILKDALFNGRGVGKNLMGLQVVDIHSGQPASFLQSIKRNIVIFGPYMLLYTSNLLLKIVPNEFVNSTVTNIVIGVGTIYTLVVIPWEVYRVYTRVDGMRFGDQLAGTVTVPADMDFSNPLSK